MSLNCLGLRGGWILQVRGVWTITAAQHGETPSLKYKKSSWVWWQPGPSFSWLRRENGMNRRPELAVSKDEAHCIPATNLRLKKKKKSKFHSGNLYNGHYFTSDNYLFN